MGDPGGYRGSPQVTTAVIPRMALMHNFASDRRELRDVIDDWLG